MRTVFVRESEKCSGRPLELIACTCVKPWRAQSASTEMFTAVPVICRVRGVAVANARDQAASQQRKGLPFEARRRLAVPPLASKLRLLLEQGTRQHCAITAGRAGADGTAATAPGRSVRAERRSISRGGADCGRVAHKVVVVLLAHSSTVHPALLRVVGRKALLLFDRKRHAAAPGSQSGGQASKPFDVGVLEFRSPCSKLF